MTDSTPQSDSEFTEFQGPANWFALRYPSELQLTQTQSVVEIRPDRHPPDWTLTLYSAWVDADNPDENVPPVSVATLFPSVVRSRQEASLDTSVSSRVWSGMSRRASGDAWWQRLRRRSYGWRLWILEHESVLLVASLQSAVNHPLSDDTVRTCDAMLQSTRFADLPAMPPEPFRREALTLARQHYPLLETKSHGRFSILLQGSEINLTNFYRSYLQQPDMLKRIVLPGLTSVVRLQEWGPDQMMPSIDEVRSRIMPMLYPEVDADTALRDFVRLPWIGGLTQAFVIDEDDTYRFVHSSLLDQWQLSVDELRELALDNLSDYAAKNPLQVNVVGSEQDPQMLIPVTPDPYNTTRILGDGFHRQLRELFGPEVIVGLPNRDFFVAVSLRNTDLISHVRDRVIQDFRSMHHPLTERLLVISADGVSEFCDTEE